MMSDKLVLAARLLLGLVFVIFGLNGFLHFIPMPPMPVEAMAFMSGLMKSGYMIPLIKIVEIIAGLFILTGMYLPLGLVLLAPIVINILLFHLVLAPDGLGMALVITILHLYLAYANKDKFAELLKK